MGSLATGAGGGGTRLLLNATVDDIGMEAGCIGMRCIRSLAHNRDSSLKPKIQRL